MNNTIVEKIQPQNIDAERSIIGACILDKQALQKALELVNYDDFYLPNHQVIFEHIEQLEKKNQVVDFVTIVDALKNTEALELIGGYEYIMDLMESVPTTANIESYCNLVKDKSIRRKLIKKCSEIINHAYSSTDKIDEILDKSQSSMIELSNLTNAKEMTHISEFIEYEMSATTESIQKGLVKPKDAISTGFADMDEMLGGGFFGGSLYFLGGRPAMGKSAKVTNLAVNVAKQDYSVGLFSLEMPGSQIAQRIISSEAGVDYYETKTRLVKNYNRTKYFEAGDDISKLPIFISDHSELNGNILKNKIRKLKIQCDKKDIDGNKKPLKLIILDYLQIMDFATDDLVKELGKVTKALKRLALELDIPILVLSQLSRAVETRQNKRPQLSDLRESGNLEQDSDVVMFIYRDEYYNPDTTKSRIAEIIFAKHRNGPTGTVEEVFEGEYSRFTNQEK